MNPCENKEDHKTCAYTTYECLSTIVCVIHISILYYKLAFKLTRLMNDQSLIMFPIMLTYRCHIDIACCLYNGLFI